MDKLLFDLLSAWANSYCHTGDDGSAVERALVAVAQQHLYGRVDLEGKGLPWHVIDLLVVYQARVEEWARHG